MSAFKSDFLNVLSSRGFIHQVSEPEALDALARSSPITAYIGFDCTAPSLHVGSLLPIMMLYWLQQTGHRPLPLMGGGTTRVGDPSGKDESRRLLTNDDINANLKSIREIFARFLRFGDGQETADKTGAVMANNADWLNGLNYIDFLRDIGRHFSINRMLTFDSVKLRLERQQELSFLEFNYMILQAYDFVELYRRYGAVWLNANQVSPYEYWQYWRNTEDADVGRFLKLFTVLPLNEIERLATLKGAEINEAKIKLATEATAMVHGREAAEHAAQTARTTFAMGGMGEGLPTIQVTIGSGILNISTQLGFTSSNAQARQFVKDGAVYVGEKRITEPSYKLQPDDFDQDGRAPFRAGQKNRAILTLKSE